MFAYCNNNPVNCVDAVGTYADAVAVGTAAGTGGVGVVIAIIIIAYFVVSDSSTTDWTKATTDYLESESEPAEPDPEPVEPANSGSTQNSRYDNKYRGGTLYNRNGLRVDYEYYGKGNGNVHLHFRGNKYRFDYNLGGFFDKNGNPIPKALKKLLNDRTVIRSIEQAFRYTTGE